MLIGRITPVARSFISIPAGVFAMPLVRYTVLTFIGSTIWCFAFARSRLCRGHALGAFHERFRYVEYASSRIVVVACVAYLLIGADRRSSSTFSPCRSR